MPSSRAAVKGANAGGECRLCASMGATSRAWARSVSFPIPARALAVCSSPKGGLVVRRLSLVNGTLGGDLLLNGANAAIRRQRRSAMRFLLTGLVTMVTILHTAASEPLKRTDPVVVRAVIDGDTIDVSNYGRVRLLGIDAPEIGRVF